MITIEAVSKGHAAHIMFTTIKAALNRRRVSRNRLWILSLDKAGLLALIVEPDTGLDGQDCDGLVQLAFRSYPEGQRDAIIERIAEHLIRPVAAWSPLRDKR